MELKIAHASVLELDQLFTLCADPGCSPERIHTLVDTVNFNSAAIYTAIDILKSNKRLAQNRNRLKLCLVILNYAVVLNTGRIIKM